jgi:hypothetical protein
VKSTRTMRPTQDLQTAAFKRMAATDYRNRLGKVFEMGSVSWFPSIRLTMMGFWECWRKGSMTKPFSN